MPLFITEEELGRHANDASFVAAKADEFIRVLQVELETVKATADATAITAEQTCSLLEQKFLSLSSEHSDLQSRFAQLQCSLDDRLAELAQVQSSKHQLHLQSIGKDGDIERLTTEVSELHKSKRQLIELVENKDLEISEKNATINSYLDRIVNLTDTAAQRGVRLTEIEAELARSQSTCARLSQAKELIERHNTWLNDELTAKVDSLIELRRKHAEVEEDLSSKLSDAERQFNECSNSLKWNKERVKELDTKLTYLQEELCKSKDAAAANEERFSAELSTVNKLVELYKESSEEWSHKAGELEGVIKALETHLVQVENDYKERLEKELSTRKELEKEVAALKDKIDRHETEVESTKKDNELSLVPLSSLATGRSVDRFDTDVIAVDGAVPVPRVPVGVSGTALAASLLRDGWTLAEMYAKYQEAVDAFRHEQLGRKESEAILQRVLCELEEKAGVILDERAEYDKMIESYSMLNDKLQNSVSEQAILERTVLELKVDLKRHERDYKFAQKEIIDLQKQVTVLLKECRDIQLRCGSTRQDQPEDFAGLTAAGTDAESDAGKIISERLLTFKDINGLVEQNVQLRTLVRDLSDQIENKEMEFKEKIEMEMRKHTNDAASKVAAVLQRAEEQGRMIESLHGSVAMYKRLYEEEHKLHSSLHSNSLDATPAVDDGKKHLLLLLEGSQEATKKAQEKASEQLRSLEEDLAKSKSGIISLRSERDKFALDAKFAGERLDSFMKEYEQLRNEMNGVLGRNVELSHLIIDFQKKLRENSEALNSSEELSRKFNMEVSVLKHEKEMLSNAERRATEEVCRLSERVHRLQASLETIQSAEVVREEARAAERRKQEEYVKQIKREWAEAKQELQRERDNVRALTSDREQTLKDAMRQVEEMGKELAEALRATSAAETRAAVAETKLLGVEKKTKTTDAKVANVDGSEPSTVSVAEAVTDLVMAKEEVEKLKEEAKANKEHMLQYKSIAQVNEDALKQMEVAHENFKIESDKLKESFEAELLSLKVRISELENELILKTQEAVSAATEKEEALSSALSEIARLKEESLSETSQSAVFKTQISALKENLEKEHELRLGAQGNYRRQVVLQSETIQELSKTSEALASLQQEASELRNFADTQKSENEMLKAKWEEEKSILERSKNQAEKKYEELNEQNKILHTRLEALHIQLAEKERSSAGISSGSFNPDKNGEAQMQSLINYLRNSKDMAETEISLLKQEKLRLQSQLESALKAAEAAQASLHAERANARSVLFTEEEIKSLQLQVREINLLRESNMQLREENKHNFEECQKLREIAEKARDHSVNQESLLREREIEVETCKKQIEMEKMEKINLESRINELLENSKKVDVKDYERMKDDLQQLQGKLREKDAELEEMKNLLSKQQEMITKLELDFAKSESELRHRENKINDLSQKEAIQKAELEKQKRLTSQFKRKSDIFLKERDTLSLEKQELIKQIEDLKQGKRPMGNTSSEQDNKAKEEKDHRIQILEKTVERQREELRKEKEDHRTEKDKRERAEKAMIEKLKHVEQTKFGYDNKLQQHKQALTSLSNELEKLKHAEGNLPEGTSVVQILSGAILDDIAAAYISAVESFEKAAHSVRVELGSVMRMETTSRADASAVGSSEAANQVASSQAAAVSTSTGRGTSPLAAKGAERNVASLPSSKPIVETRKPTRRLVRPRLDRPEEAHADVEMSEADGSNAGGKLVPSDESESRQNVTSLSLMVARKRPASSSTDLSEQLLNHGDTGSDPAPPMQKKPKGSELSQEGVEGQSAGPLDDVSTALGNEESSDAVADAQVSNDEAATEQQEVTIGEKSEPVTDLEQLEGSDQYELQRNKEDFVEEVSERPGETLSEFGDGSKDLAMEEKQLGMAEFEGEREEGELPPDVVEFEKGGDLSNMVGSTEVGELVLEGGGTPLASPSKNDEETQVASGAEVVEINSPEAANDEKNEDGDVEEIAEGSDKSNDGNGQVAVESDQTTETDKAAAASNMSTATANTDVNVSEQVGSSTTEPEEAKQQASPSSSTVVNLAARAKERSMLRQLGGQMPPPGTRGRGRALRGRNVRGARGGRGRGQTPGQ